MDEKERERRLTEVFAFLFSRLDGIVETPKTLIEEKKREIVYNIGIVKANLTKQPTL